MSETAQKFTVGGLLFLLLLVGVTIHDDYGISWDEYSHRFMGIVSSFYVNEILGLIPLEFVMNFGGESHQTPPDLEVYAYRNYGVFLEMILVGTEYLFNLTDSRQAYLLRHFLTFIVYVIGVVLFYLIIQRVYNNRVLAILGCILLVTSPRIFAHSFYDLKDIAPLTFVIASIYTLVRFLEEKTIILVVAHALSIAMFIDTRIVGIYLLPITFLFFGVELYFTHRLNKSLANLFRSLFVFIISLVGFVYLLWPYLWEQPIQRLVGAIINMSNFADQYSYDGQMLYMGKFISVKDAPWHYLPVWILITTPVAYSVLFIAGSLAIFYRLLKLKMRVFTNSVDQFSILVLVVFYCPVIGVIVFSSMLLDGWRHMYFCYPAFVLVGIAGIEYLKHATKNVVREIQWRRIQLVGRVAVGLAIVVTLSNMVANHPYQNVYFSMLAGDDIEKDWELDYWGSSFRQGLEGLLVHDKSSSIKVSVSSEPGKTNLKILPRNDRDRVVIVGESEATYHLSNYRYRYEYERFHSNAPPFDKEIFSIEVSNILDDYRIMGMYLVNE